MLAKISPTSPRGSMPEPDEQPVADAAEQPETGHDLADRCHDDERADEQQQARVAERVEVGVDADLQEEHRDEEMARPARARGACARPARCR